MACLETYATLRIFSESKNPDEISRILGFEGTFARPINPVSRHRHERESNHWSWSTRQLIQSTDGLEHIGAVIEVLRGKEARLQQLRELNCEIDLSCYWVSSGQGGPFLDRSSLSALASLGLDIWWDVYFDESSDRGGATPAIPVPQVGDRT